MNAEVQTFRLLNLMTLIVAAEMGFVTGVGTGYEASLVLVLPCPCSGLLVCSVCLVIRCLTQRRDTEETPAALPAIRLHIEMLTQEDCIGLSVRQSIWNQ